MDLSSSVDGELPEFCLNPSSGIFGWFYKASRQEECINFLKAMNLHHMANVDIAVVFMKTIQAMLSWVPALSHSASEAVDEFFGDSWIGSFTGYIAKITMAPILMLVGLLGLAVFLVTCSTFRFTSPIGELSYGHQAQDVHHQPEQVEGPRQRLDITFIPNQLSNENRRIPAMQSAERKQVKGRGRRFKNKTKRSKTSPAMQPQPDP